MSLRAMGYPRRPPAYRKEEPHEKSLRLQRTIPTQAAPGDAPPPTDMYTMYAPTP